MNVYLYTKRQIQGVIIWLAALYGRIGRAELESWEVEYARRRPGSGDFLERTPVAPALMVECEEHQTKRRALRRYPRYIQF